jgi:hypothetical protein
MTFLKSGAHRGAPAIILNETSTLPSLMKEIEEYQAKTRLVLMIPGFRFDNEESLRQFNMAMTAKISYKDLFVILKTSDEVVTPEWLRADWIILQTEATVAQGVPASEVHLDIRDYKRVPLFPNSQVFVISEDAEEILRFIQEAPYPVRRL